MLMLVRGAQADRNCGQSLMVMIGERKAVAMSKRMLEGNNVQMIFTY